MQGGNAQGSEGGVDAAGYETRSGGEGPAGGHRYVLWLFVADEEPNSVQAQANLAQVCQKYLEGRYELVVHDVLQDFHSALDQRVLVTPTLIRVAPPPRVTILGNLSETDRVLAALRLTGGGA